MATKSMAIEVTKDERLDGKNYGIQHRKVQYLLNNHELLDHLTNNMCPPKAWNSAQHHRHHESYVIWFKRDKSACFTLLACMHDDLVGEHYSTTKEMWDQLRLKYGGTITTRFRALSLRFNQYIMVPKHTMVEHLTVISTMVRKMKEIGYDLIY